MPISPFIAAINQICDEKGLKQEEVMSAVEQAVAAAYRKDYGKPREMIRAKFNEKTNKFKIYQEFEVVDQKLLEKQAKERAEEQGEEFNKEQVKIDSATQLTLKEAKKLDPNAKVGETVKKDLPEKENFGRIAAQTAKQVIIQRLRESERNMLFLLFLFLFLSLKNQQLY